MSQYSLSLKPSLGLRIRYGVFGRGLGKLREFFQGNPTGIIGGSIMALVLVACLAAPLFTQYEPDKRVARPHVEPGTEHILGTTRQGRDVFSQVLHGGRTSLAVAFIAGTIATLISIVVGIAAGYFGGRIDQWLNFAMNVVLVFPQLPLLIVLAAFLGQVGPTVIALLIGITSWPWGARVIRSQTMALRQKEFVLAAECMGENTWRILLVEILPNLTAIVAGSFAKTGANGNFYGNYPPGADLSHWGDNGELVFDLRVNSLAEGVDLLVKLDSGWPNVSDTTVSLPAVGAWTEVRLNIADLVAEGNSVEPGQADLGDILNPVVFEPTGVMDFDVDNIRYEKVME